MSSEIFLEPGDIIEYKTEFTGEAALKKEYDIDGLLWVRGYILRFKAKQWQDGEAKGEFYTSVVYIRGRRNLEVAGKSVEKVNDALAEITELKEVGVNLPKKIREKQLSYFTRKYERDDLYIVKKGTSIRCLENWQTIENQDRGWIL